VNGEYSKAIEAFKKAIEIDPVDSAAHFNLGIAYFLSGDSTAASQECTILRDIDKAKADSLTDLIY
jgi:Flp pilus assembly protein TadD